MFEANAISEFGEKFRATGPTAAAARHALIRKIERATGAELQKWHDGQTAEFERFAEPLPDGEFEVVCFKAAGGRIVCQPKCACRDKSRCTCGNGHNTFSEKKSMKPFKSKRRRFDESDDDDARRQPSRDKMLQHLAEAGLDPEALQDASDATLAEICRFVDSQGSQYVEGGVKGGGNNIGDDRLPADQPRNSEERKFCEKLAGYMSFSENKKPLSPSQIDYLRAFRAERKVNPKVCAEDWFPRR